MVTCFQVWVYEGVCVVWWRWGDIVCWPVYRYGYTKVCVKCGEGEVTDFLCVCVCGLWGGILQWRVIQGCSWANICFIYT